MRLIIAVTAVVATIVAADPAAKPQPEHVYTSHGLAKRWNGFGAWGCGCPFYGGIGYGTGVGYGYGT
ncbi:hypothetical protein FBU31_007065, partial [Coemansia sp. 'formosensis']